MRLFSALLFVALTGSVALADDAKPADSKPEVTKRKVPLRVVRMLPETHQALLYDRIKGTHVVAEVGQELEGYIVDELDGDEVTLVAPSGAEVILTAPDQSWRRRQAEQKAAARAATTRTEKGEPAPQDPYVDATDDAPATAPSTAPAAPAAAVVAAGDNGVRVTSAAEAPVDPYADMDPGVAAFMKAVNSSGDAPSPSPAPTPTTATPAPSPASTASTATRSDAAAAAPTAPPAKAATDGAALGAAITGAPAPAATPAVSPGPTTATIKRAEINAALGDFAGTASTFKATFTPEGLRFDAVSKGSLIAKVGLDKGDVITAIDGQPLHSLDDAANLYARLPTARGSTIQILRAGKPTTLRISIQ